MNLAAPEVVQIGSIRLGLTLDAARRPALVLSAHDVMIGSHPYIRCSISPTPMPSPTLPETRSATSRTPSSAGSGLPRTSSWYFWASALAVGPGEAPWPVDPVGLPALLADAVGALLGQHRAVLDAACARYVERLDPLHRLLRTAAVDVRTDGR